MSKYETLESLLKDKPKVHVTNYVRYCQVSEAATKDGKPKNPQFAKLSAERLAELFNKVYAEGLVLDGKHITIQTTGIMYDYVAYKNKMLNVYPDSLIDISLVYQGDEFSVAKDSGLVNYSHTLGSPFNQTDDKIEGGYVVIKNKRGEFLTTMSKADFEKHKEVARGKHIWNKWYKEMCLKTLMRKATKYHFDDLFDGMNEDDNKHFNLSGVSQYQVDYALNLLENSTIHDRRVMADWESKIMNCDSDSFDSLVNELKDLQKPDVYMSATDAKNIVKSKMESE